MEDCKVDSENCPTERSRCQSNILTKAGRLNCCIGYAMGYLSKKHKCKFINELGKKQMIMKRHLAYLQHYEHIYEQSAKNPVQCLSLMKKDIRVSYTFKAQPVFIDLVNQQRTFD